MALCECCQQLYSSRPASGPVTVLLPVVPCGRARKTHQWTPLSKRWASWRRVAARWVKKEARHRAQAEWACPQQTMDGTSNSFSSCNAGAGFAIPRQQPRPRALRLEFQAMAIAPSPSASRPKPSSTAHIHRNSVLRQCCVTQVHGFAIRSGLTSRAKPGQAGPSRHRLQRYLPRHGSNTLPMREAPLSAVNIGCRVMRSFDGYRVSRVACRVTLCVTSRRNATTDVTV